VCTREEGRQRTILWILEEGRERKRDLISKTEKKERRKVISQDIVRSRENGGKKETIEVIY